eukprot:9166296-Alexandrium_andersonii.AAC.1
MRVLTTDPCSVFGGCVFDTLLNALYGSLCNNCVLVTLGSVLALWVLDGSGQRLACQPLPRCRAARGKQRASSSRTDLSAIVAASSGSMISCCTVHVCPWDILVGLSLSTSHGMMLFEHPFRKPPFALPALVQVVT